MLPSHIKYILVGSHVPIFVVCIYTIIIYKNLTSLYKSFGWFVFSTAIIQAISLIMALFKHNNLPLLHLYVPLGFALLIWFYHHILGNFVNKRILIFTALIFSVFSIFNSLFFQPILSFNSNALTAESVLLIILSISTYSFLLNTFIKRDQQLISSLNWINSGIFIYYTSSLLLFHFGSKILSVNFPREYSLYSWILHSFFSIIMYTCFFIGLWKRPNILIS